MPMIHPTYDHPTTVRFGPLSGYFNRMSDFTDVSSC